MPNQGLQTQPLPIGQQGTATFKPNWGQPIVGGQWQGQSQAAPAIDPRKVISDELGSLRASFKQRANTLKASGLDADIHNRILAGWQDEYDQAKAELTGATSQLDLIQQQVGAGGMTQEAGREAAIRMIVPRETADLMFPSVRAVTPGATGISPSQQKTGIEFYEDVMQASIINPPGWGKGERKQADPTLLEEIFLDQWDAQNLDDPRNEYKRSGFILSWKNAAARNRHTKKTWTAITGPNGSVDVRSRIAPDSDMGRVIKSKVQDKGVSPLGKAFKFKKFRGASAGMTYSYTPPTAQQQTTQTKPRRQYNQKTGQTRVSYDEGKTWQIE